MAEIPTLSLKVADWKPATFTASQYNPQLADSTILPKSLLTVEGREKEAYAHTDAIDEALSKTRAMLDPSEHEWFDKKANDVRDLLDFNASLGRSESVIRLAREAARDFKRDIDLANKTEVNNKRQQFLKEVKAMNIDPVTKRWAEDVNKYYYDGTSDWKPQRSITNDVSIPTLMNLAAQMTPEFSDSNRWETSEVKHTYLDADGNETTDPTKAISVKYNSSHGSGGGIGYHTKSKERLEQSFRNLLNDPAVKDSLFQKFEVTDWAWKNAQARSQDMSLSEQDRLFAAKEAAKYLSEITDNDGIIIDNYEDWIEKKIIPMFKDMEYYNQSTSSSNHTNDSIDDAQLARNVGAFEAESLSITEDVEVKGEQTQTTYNDVWNAHGWYKAAEIITRSKEDPTFDASSYGNLF